jgi:hypothetical protein
MMLAVQLSRSSSQRVINAVDSDDKMLSLLSALFILSAHEITASDQRPFFSQILGLSKLLLTVVQ